MTPLSLGGVLRRPVGSAPAPRVGLTEMLAAPALGADLGSGFTPEQGLRVCLVGMLVGTQAGIRDGELADLFQSTLLLALELHRFRDGECRLLR